MNSASGLRVTAFANGACRKASVVPDGRPDDFQLAVEEE